MACRYSEEKLVVSYEDILVERRDGIGWITINRPEVSNAVRPLTMKEICGAFDTLESDPAAGAIVITGRGRHFAAGGDFDFLKGLCDTSTSDVRDELYTHLRVVRSFGTVGGVD